jgi:hypothetical protein
MPDSGRGIRGHGIRYLAATSDLAGAADPRQTDAQACAIAAIHTPGVRLFVLELGGGAGTPRTPRTTFASCARWRPTRPRLSAT